MGTNTAAANFELMRESLNCGDGIPDQPEVTDEHLAKAVDQLVEKSPGDIFTVLDNSSFFKEHAADIVRLCPRFRKELIESQDIQIAAQQIANKEARDAREQADVDDSFDDEPTHEYFDGR